MRGTCGGSEPMDDMLLGLRNPPLVAHLHHDAGKRPQADHMQRHPEQQLVKHGRDKEDEDHRRPLGQPVADGGVVDVPEQPFVHGHVPQPPILSDGRGIPPVLVELPVPKPEMCDV